MKSKQAKTRSAVVRLVPGPPHYLVITSSYPTTPELTMQLMKISRCVLDSLDTHVTRDSSRLFLKPDTPPAAAYRLCARIAKEVESYNRKHYPFGPLRLPSVGSTDH